MRRVTDADVALFRKTGMNRYTLTCKKICFVQVASKPPQPFKILRCVVIQHGSAIRNIQLG